MNVSSTLDLVVINRKESHVSLVIREPAMFFFCGGGEKYVGVATSPVFHGLAGCPLAQLSCGSHRHIINMYDRICVKPALKQFPSAKIDSSESSYSTRHGSC